MIRQPSMPDNPLGARPTVFTVEAHLNWSYRRMRRLYVIWNGIHDIDQSSDQIRFCTSSPYTSPQYRGCASLRQPWSSPREQSVRPPRLTLDRTRSPTYLVGSGVAGANQSACTTRSRQHDDLLRCLSFLVLCFRKSLPHVRFLIACDYTKRLGNCYIR